LLGGGAYLNTIKSLQSLQNRISKIIFNNTFLHVNRPLSFIKKFELESLTLHYKFLQYKYLSLHSFTRNKLIIIPKISKSIGFKNSFVRAVKLFNSLPTELKSLKVSSKRLKSKLKRWIQNDELRNLPGS
jgi:hypothetical protein